MTMWQAQIERKQFTQLLQRDLPAVALHPREDGERKRLQNGRIGLVWAEKPRNGELPVALVVPEVEIGDFFAWANTYLPNWSPMSAYFRVFSDREGIIRDSHTSAERERILEAASIGLIVAEALGQSGEEFDIDRISMSACIATFSYAASQGVRRNVEMKDLAREWSNCRSLTGQAPLRIEVESMLGPWETVADMANDCLGAFGVRSRQAKGRLFVEGLEEVVEKGEIGETTWRRLTTGFPMARQAIEPMKGTQEERVIVLEKVLGGRTTKSRYSAEDSFVAGYLGSRIFPGTIKHASLVLKYLERYPSAVLWLGLFAGLHGRRELSLSNLGRHLWRAIAGEESVLTRPRCDIGLRELRVLAEGGMFGTQYRTATPGRLVVDLHPNVTTVVRWPAQDVAREVRRQGELFASRGSEMGGVVKDLKETRRSLDRAITKLERWIQSEN